MTIRTIILAFCFLILPLAAARALVAAPPPQPEPVGTVVSLRGDATVTRKTGENAGQPQKIATGDFLYTGDQIATGENAAMALHFIDDTDIQMGPGGSFAVDDYVYDPQNPAGNKAHYTILKTAFAYASGKIGKTANPDVKIGLDLGSIGIRGTKLLRGMRQSNCWIYLEEGAITVSTDVGEVALAPQQMTRLSSREAAPLEPAPWVDADVDWIRQAVKP